jgi:hypothetical protein
MRSHKPGTELKNLLSKFNIYSNDCECDDHALLMDTMGTEWCLKNIDTITGWLLREAEKRGVILNKLAKLFAKYIVKEAIKRAK